MGIYATKARWQHGLIPFVSWCVRRRIHPDVFTYGALGLSFIAAFALVLAGSARAWLWLVPPCLIGRLICNLMDGLVARARGLDDALGEVKNEFGDRLVDAVIFLGLAFGGESDPRLVALILALVLCVSYLGLLSKAIGGPRLYTGIFGKGDRMISLALWTLAVASGAVPDFNLYLALASAAAWITILQRLRRIYAHTQSAR